MFGKHPLIADASTTICTRPNTFGLLRSARISTAISAPLTASAFFRISRNPGPGKLSISQKSFGIRLAVCGSKNPFYALHQSNLSKFHPTSGPRAFSKLGQSIIWRGGLTISQRHRACVTQPQLCRRVVSLTGDILQTWSNAGARGPGTNRRGTLSISGSQSSIGKSTALRNYAIIYMTLMMICLTSAYSGRHVGVSEAEVSPIATEDDSTADGEQTNFAHDLQDMGKDELQARSALDDLAVPLLDHTNPAACGVEVYRCLRGNARAVTSLQFKQAPSDVSVVLKTSATTACKMNHIIPSVVQDTCCVSLWVLVQSALI